MDSTRSSSPSSTLSHDSDAGEYVTLRQDAHNGRFSIVEIDNISVFTVQNPSKQTIASEPQTDHSSSTEFVFRLIKVKLCSILHFSHFILFLIFFYLFLRLSSEMQVLLQREQDVPLVTNDSKTVIKRSVPMSGLLENNLQGTIGPWIIDNNEKRNWAKLSHDRSELLILQTGVYFISAQIFYLTGGSSNSYEIVKLSSPDEKETLTVCAHQASSKGTNTDSAEVTCCTAVIGNLKNGDRLRLHQIEQDRVILFSRGFSHWGIIKIHGKIDD